MKKILVLYGFAMLLISCGTTKPVRTYSKNTSVKKSVVGRNLTSNAKDKKESKLVNNILSDAEKYIGTPYQLGGMSYSGIDCSGLVSVVFKKNDLKIARRSVDQAKEGREIRVGEVRKGDLLFFATAGGRNVSHIGIVHKVENSGEIKFIHASTTKGVIISSLNDIYWNKVFLFARRVI